MIRKTAIIAPFLLAVLVSAVSPAPAQIALRRLGDLNGVVGRLDSTVTQTAGDLRETAADVTSDAGRLAQARIDRLADYVRANRRFVAFDDRHQPARAGEILLLDPDVEALTTARAAGFGMIEEGEVAGLGLRFARLGVPEGQDLAKALTALRKVLPGRMVTADQLHFPAGSAARAGGAPAGEATPPQGGSVGVIDGGIAPGPRLAAVAGFAAGAPMPNAHAGFIASLLAGAGTARVYSADVYGRDPAGGDALAIARALGWMVSEHVAVVSISLVGPANPLLARAVALARARGTVIVAAVGNDGPAAPPAFPASYPEAFAVTGVDGHDRVLIEAGHALHLDYAAPGADLTALDANGRRVGLRGTSFAAPLAAARFAAWREVLGAAAPVPARLDAEATHPHGKGYGHGILCEACRRGQ